MQAVILSSSRTMTTRSHIYRTPRLLTEMISLTIDNQRHGLKRTLKFCGIHDTFYFKPCYFTLDALYDFVLTYSKQEYIYGCNYQLFQLCRHKPVQKSPLSVFTELFLQQRSIFPSFKENASATTH